MYKLLPDIKDFIADRACVEGHRPETSHVVSEKRKVTLRI